MTETMWLSAISDASPKWPTTRPHLARGRATILSTITWEGAVAKAFTPTPFNLTMEIEQDKIEGLEKKACVPTAPGVRRPAAPATKKQ